MQYAARLFSLICCLSLSFTPSGAVEEEKSTPAPFVDIQDGKVTMGKLATADLEDGLAHLASVNDHHREAGFGDGVVMDCQVVKTLPKDKYGQPSWCVRPIHIYSGGEQIRKPTVVLKSPTLENNGIQLVTKKRYKLFALDVEYILHKKRGPLYSWGGVIPLN